MADAGCAETMIWVGTSGWVYRDWVGRFYPADLPQGEQLAFYARHFPTVEINRSYYRLPTRDNFRAWATQSESQPGFCFAVKASRWITHMKKLRDTEEAVAHLAEAASGLGSHLGPMLYQLPPRWKANPERLSEFVASLPPGQRAAFEFRDPTWFSPEIARILEAAGCATVIGVGGGHPTPAEAPIVGPFRYIRFHWGAHGIGFTDAELAPWAERLRADHAAGLTCFVYFNNDPGGNAIRDALRLRDMLGPSAVPVLPAAAMPVLHESPTASTEFG